MSSLHGAVPLLLLGAIVLPVAEAALGGVKLDNMTFDKMLSVPGLTLLAKIDKAYPYGDKEETFKELCKLSYRVKDFLIGEIPVQEYGDKENEDLQKRFDVKTDDFPVYFLFKNGAAEPPIRFQGFPDPNAKKPATWDDDEDGPWEPPFRTDVTPENFVTWLRMQGVKMPYGGTIFDLDQVAQRFMKTGFKDEDLTEAKKMAEDEYKHDPKASVYIKIMQKIKEKGAEYVEKEMARVKKLMAGKLTPAKLSELEGKVSILRVFDNPL